MIRLLILFTSLTVVFIACKSNKINSDLYNKIDKPVPDINYTYLKSFPHDTAAFTEGLLIYNGHLFESTGASDDLPQTRSLFGIVDTLTGKIITKVELDRLKYFGEGIAFLHDKVYQLTYRTKIGFIYNAKTFKKIGEFTFPSDEGWGLTTDGKYLIMSDGTNKLTYLDAETLQPVKILIVTENSSYKNYLNELEFIDGFIYANIWLTNTIVKIDTSSGNIVGKMDLTPFTEECKSIYDNSNVLNGIAYDSVTNTVFLTGKLWPRLYQIRIKD